MPDVFITKQGSLFIQRALSQDPEYFGCYDVGDISAPEGDFSLIQVFDATGKYQTLGSTQAAPSVITFTLTTYVQKKADFLEHVACPFYLHVNLRCDGLANIIDNYERAVVLKVFGRSGRTLKALVMREGEGKAEQDFDLAAAPPVLDIYKLVPDRQTLTEVLALNDVFFINGDLCGNCLPRYEAGSIGIAVADSAAGPATANVRYTLDKGSNWGTAATDPFIAAMNVIAATGFWLTGKVFRFLVANGTTQAGAPAQVAYTDFNVETDTAIGAVWTTANVGATNAQFFFGPKSLYAYDQFNIWAVAGAGFIYYSSNGGLTWTAQESGVLSVSPLYVLAADPANPKTVIWAAGENNAIARTRDGGVTWSSVTGPSAQATDEIIAMDVVNSKTVFLGYNDGNIYVTYDGGVTWSNLATFTGSGVGQVRAIKFLNEMQGFMLTNNASPVGAMHMTRDGGRTFEALTTPANAGLNALAVVDATQVYAVGEALSSLAVIVKTTN